MVAHAFRAGALTRTLETVGIELLAEVAAVVLVFVVAGLIALQTILAVLALQTPLEDFSALPTHSPLHKVGPGLAPDAPLLQGALLTVRKHVVAGPTVVFVRVERVDFALGAVEVILAFDAVAYHGSALVAGVAVRFETRVRLAFCAVGRGGAFQTVLEGGGAGQTG